ncbi:MAG: ABC transporter ATP-binding protein [Candidatus Nitronauta litoralis]|uniref:ABC transporter ATP-binding protein n=1 Tax=Candidatus Nitronauta litoralis TaxID=2705533 RepID=A0A7T0FZ72_9BACT|nr:MAG: ABC transporter ATP-binding protein [Candidatus Nitronauta litoralis]
MIQIQELVKNYGNFTAVDGIDLEIPAGQFFGCLGPNGAGKTTTIKMLVGILKPTRGKIFIGGKNVVEDPVQAKAMIGYIPDRPFIYDKLSGLEYLAFIADIYGMDATDAEKKAQRFLEFFDLGRHGGELIEGYSHGMKQKLVISGALLHEPKVLIVDEPIVGLDPKGARQVKDLFTDVCRKGATIFMSTHSLGIAQAMCDRIGIIQHGKMIALGTMEDLRRQAKKNHEDLEDLFLELTGDTDLENLVKTMTTP